MNGYFNTNCSAASLHISLEGLCCLAHNIVTSVCTISFPTAEVTTNFDMHSVIASNHWSGTTTPWNSAWLQLAPSCTGATTAGGVGFRFIGSIREELELGFGNALNMKKEHNNVYVVVILTGWIHCVLQSESFYTTGELWTWHISKLHWKLGCVQKVRLGEGEQSQPL